MGTRRRYRCVFNSLEECEEKLKKLKIEWTTSHKITHTVTEMTNSGIFNEEYIMDWEDKEGDEKSGYTVSHIGKQSSKR